jgi:glutathione S-transferase
MPSLVLWGVRGASCVQRITFTAAELDAPYTFNKIDWMTGQHRSPEHLKRQPFGKVPAAEWDGQPFFESRAIARILAEAHQDRLQLLPRDLKAKAVFEQWASLESNTFDPLLDVLIVEQGYKPMQGKAVDQQLVDATMEKLAQPLQVLDAQLATRDYITGQFSLVDIIFAPTMQVLQGVAAGKQILAQHPNIASWWSRLSQRPAWQAVLQQKNL